MSKKNAILAASKSGLFAIVANGIASLVGRRWFDATTWHDEHHRRASRSPLSGSAPNAGLIARVAAIIKHRQMQQSLQGPSIWDDLHVFQQQKIFIACYEHIRTDTPGQIRTCGNSPSHAAISASNARSFFSSGISVMVASVNNRTLATDTAFSSAMRTTLVGSMMPASTRSTYSLRPASKP